MKKIYLLVSLGITPILGLGQKAGTEQMAIIGHVKPDSVISDPNSFVKWFSKNVKIGQSMETADQQAEPAQFQLTVPRKDTTSYLINLGMSVSLDFIDWLSGNQFISKLKTEYHKNTLTEKKQDNFEIGYQGTWNFASSANDKTLFFFIFDPKYNYDAISYKNSIASNVLFSWLTDESKLNWNTNNYQLDNTFSEFYSLFAGAQAQEVIKTKVDTGTGFILRPLYTASVAIAWNRKNKIHKPILKLTTIYTGRWDLINSTVGAEEKEGYTQLLKCGLDWYVVNDPLKVSFGTSYNYGSDPLKGLLEQRYWLFSVNIAL